jgi:hypothetical protein
VFDHAKEIVERVMPAEGLLGRPARAYKRRSEQCRLEERVMLRNGTILSMGMEYDNILVLESLGVGRGVDRSFVPCGLGLMAGFGDIESGYVGNERGERQDGDDLGHGLLTMKGQNGEDVVGIGACVAEGWGVKESVRLRAGLINGVSTST